MSDHLATYHQIVCSNPATAFAIMEWRDGGLVVREVLDRMRSG